MNKSLTRTDGPSPTNRGFRFGLRRLLATILVLAVVCGGIGNLHHRAQEQSALVAALSGVGIRPVLEEPTGLGFWVKKRMPGQETWIRDHIGEGWFSTPTVLVCSGLNEEGVTLAVEGMRRLGTVREIHYTEGKVSDESLAKIRSGLRGVGVVATSDRAGQTYFLGKTTGEQFALDGVIFEGFLVVGLLGVMFAILRQCVVCFRRKSRERVADRETIAEPKGH